jgi:hypothetical protein
MRFWDSRGELHAPISRSSRAGRHDLVREGAVFRRVHPDQMVEKARVLSVGPGPMGIPHVRFAVSFERARFAFFEDGPRVLALASFTEFYKEPVLEAGVAA